MSNPGAAKRSGRISSTSSDSRMRIDLDLCSIRPWRRSDRGSLVRHGNNRKVWRNLADIFPHPYTEQDAETWFALLEQQVPLTNFAIEIDGEAIGGIGLTCFTDIGCKTAEFGHWLGEAHWGRGIATEAGKAFVAWAFENHPLERLQAGVFEWNPASMRVLEKIGCLREGVLRRSVFKDGQVIDRVLYAITRDSTRGPA